MPCLSKPRLDRLARTGEREQRMASHTARYTPRGSHSSSDGVDLRAEPQPAVGTARLLHLQRQPSHRRRAERARQLWVPECTSLSTCASATGGERACSLVLATKVAATYWRAKESPPPPLLLLPPPPPPPPPLRLLLGDLLARKVLKRVGVGTLSVARRAIGLAGLGG